MKGHFIKNDISFELVTKDQTQIQGSHVSGFLKIKNNQKELALIQKPSVALSLGDFKSVYSKKENAFEEEQCQIFLEELKLLPAEEKEFPFQFLLDENCLITDKKQSYFLNYGEKGLGNNLQLTITPHEIFLKVSELIQNFLRFKLKEHRPYKKGKKTGVEFKYLPPGSRDLANIESFILGQRLDKDNLEWQLLFNIKKLNLTQPLAPAEKQIKTFELTLLQKDIVMGTDRLGGILLNHDFVVKKLEEILSQVRIKGLA